jgi:hypothetical protein
MHDIHHDKDEKFGKLRPLRVHANGASYKAACLGQLQ